MGTISEKLTYLSNTKKAIKDAIIAKGVAVSGSDTFRGYAQKIADIPSGSGDLPQLINPATAANILKGKQAINGSGTVMTGTYEGSDAEIFDVNIVGEGLGTGTAFPTIIHLEGSEVVDNFDVKYHAPVGLAPVPASNTIAAGQTITAELFSSIKLLLGDGMTEDIPAIIDPASAQTITSPNWPGNYDNSVTEAASAVTKTFEGAAQIAVIFDSTSQTEARYDFVRIYDKTDTLLYTLSGTEMAGQTYIISSDTVKITFSSDGSSAFKGFSASVGPILDPLSFTPATAPSGAGVDFDVTVTFSADIPDVRIGTLLGLTGTAGLRTV